MAKKLIHVLVAATGIAVASGAAWWWQNRTAAAPAAASGGSAAPGQAPAGGPRAAAGGPPSVEVTSVRRMRLQDDAQAVGTLRSRQSVTLKPEVAGRVQCIAFADGAQVRRGQLLVQLDDTLQAAELLQAQAQLSIAQTNFNRNQELVAQNFVAQRVLDESRAALQVAQAQVTLAQARKQRGDGEADVQRDVAFRHQLQIVLDIAAGMIQRHLYRILQRARVMEQRVQRVLLQLLAANLEQAFAGRVGEQQLAVALDDHHRRFQQFQTGVLLRIVLVGHGGHSTLLVLALARNKPGWARSGDRNAE